MRKTLALLFVALLLLGCSDSQSDTPLLKLVNVYIGEDETNYAESLEQLPVLSLGDEVDLTFQLDGNGHYLKTFVVVNDNSSLATEVRYVDKDVSEELSEEFEGVFFNDIYKTQVEVKATVVRLREESPTLSFFLSSKTMKSEGASFYLELSVETNP